MTGLEIPIFLGLKFVAVKAAGLLLHTAVGQAAAGAATSYTVGTVATHAIAHAAIHSSAIALQHASMSFAWRVISGAAGATTLLGGGYALVHGAWQMCSISEAMEEAQKDMERPSRCDSCVNGGVLHSYDDYASAHKARLAVYSVLNHIYRSLGHMNYNGSHKTTLSQVEACADENCNCLDYAANGPGV
ncbi:hypothetical protein M408DRAFT_11025 [Serendipita vermifera MAFF 305830]|uniref:Uncharacterized protein n=1 Tax=Serendipita vermifera MAFF 305830 TaxID=933852 RepID=A0A0C3AWR9_SERVB|nr:hypothetical protein M408DRAFT_11025 [Serendipita vermifera MAFF 305830]